MAETLQEFIVRRRGELDAEASRLKLDLLVVEAEREKVDKVAMMLGDDASLPHKYDFVSEVPPPHRAGRRVSEATIKELVLKILEQERPGLTALDILPRIAERTGIEYPRTSLSPQLSRLKAEGKIHREGRLWMLGDGPDTPSDLDDLLGQSRGNEENMDEAPTTGAEAS